jgi:hypothetical protein
VASETPKKGPQQDANKKGLEKEYAFRWSYGIAESFTLLIPDFEGSASGYIPKEGQLDGVSDQFIQLLDKNFNGRIPMYHGDLPSTSGPIYLGAIFIALFVFAIFVVVILGKKQPDDPRLKMAKSLMWFSIILTVL